AVNFWACLAIGCKRVATGRLTVFRDADDFAQRGIQVLRLWSGLEVRALARTDKKISVFIKNNTSAVMFVSIVSRECLVNYLGVFDRFFIIGQTSLSHRLLVATRYRI